jgi:hypothetical protein
MHLYVLGAVRLYFDDKKFDKYSWGILTKPETASWVYLASWVPRSQSEVIKRIYKERKVNNIHPVIAARKHLQDLGYLEVKMRAYEKDLRRTQLRAKVEGFAPYVEKTIADRKSSKGEQSLSDNERRVLFRMLDCEWFRHSLDEYLGYGVTMPGACQTLAEFLEQVATVSNRLGSRFRGNLPQPNEVLGYESFDSFMNSWSSKKIEPHPEVMELLECARRCLRSDLPYDPTVKLLVKNTLDSPHPALCIPEKLSWKLSAISRIQRTLIVSLDDALRQADNHH